MKKWHHILRNGWHYITGICILNEKEVFDSEKIVFCYKINLAEEKTNLIQVFRVLHPSIGIGRTFIYEFNKPDR